jgi:MoxR-like ATPase
MSRYIFRLVNADIKGQSLEDTHMLMQRPSQGIALSFQEDAQRFIPGEELETAINTAIAVSEPLLITGEPGTGKTQTAYYAAHKLGIEPVIHFQVKSDSTGKDLLYHFDTVRYFHDANFAEDRKSLDKDDYVEKRALWDAIVSEETKILLIDEIDKAPRDFPNDLLLELDKMEFKILETGKVIKGDRNNRPIVFITSNSERRLPEPFLRRCVYHHITFDRNIVEKAVMMRRDGLSGNSRG